MIKENHIDFSDLENIVLDEKHFESYDTNDMNIYALLFQTGYLTIKKVKYDNSSYEKEYTLSYPNLEVKQSFLNFLLKDLSTNKQIDKAMKINNLVKSLKKDDIKEFINIVKTIFADIPYDIFIQDQERYYHSVLYLVMNLIGVKITSEMETNKGRIDCVIETEKSVFIFEFKLGSAKKAIEQIENKQYYAKYLGGNKKIFLVGVGFSQKKKNIYSLLVKNK